MIKLDVREYCDSCPHFEPEVVMRPHAQIFTPFDPINFEKEIVTITGDTIVKCCNRDRCEAIYEYMEGQKKC